MIRVGWLYDKPPFIGGAELTEREFRAAAPDGVKIVDCPPGAVDTTCDVYAIHNCITYALTDLEAITAPVFKYWNDTGSWYDEQVRAVLDRQAMPICISPIQADYMGLPDAVLIPPPVDLWRFTLAAQKHQGDRHGAISVGSWRNRGKGAHAVERWAHENGVEVEFIGGGAFAPPSSRQIAYQGMPSILAAHRTFVFLPEVIEPFGRCVVEAWAAGCEIVTNELVGAAYWIREAPEKLSTAADDFWRLVLDEQADTAGQVGAGGARRGAGEARDSGAPPRYGKRTPGAESGVLEAAGEKPADQVGQAAR